MDDKDKIVNILENQNELKKISYPISMIEKKLDGRCIARFRLNEDGSARNIVIVQSLGQAFDSEVIEGIKRMRFKPVRPEGSLFQISFMRCLFTSKINNTSLSLVL